MKFISASIIVLSGAIVVCGSLFVGSHDDNVFGKFVGCVLGLAGLAGWIWALRDEKS